MQRVISNGVTVQGVVLIDTTTGLPYNAQGGAISGSVTTSKAKTTALASSLVVKASSGTLLGITGINTSDSDLYIQVHNTISLPADASVPDLVFIAYAGQNFSLFLNVPYPLNTGIVVCNSTTLATKTIGSANCWFNVQYT